MNRKPVCVITGDIHFTPGALELASLVVTRALGKAEELGVPFMMNGDTLDTKAIMRGECVNRLLDLIGNTSVPVYINRGNHDAISERSWEHTLNFLRPYATIVQSDVYIKSLDSWAIPYQHDPKEFERILAKIPKGSRVIVHQGVVDSDMGHYSHDHSAVSKSLFADYRGIGSHYHKAQDIKCGRPRKGAVGSFSYCGSPYTVSFAEAGDGPKGFQILYDDGSLELVPTNLRKHVILEYTTDELNDPFRFHRPEDPSFYIKPEDLVWVKLKGTTLQLDYFCKDGIQELLGLPENYRLDKIPTDDVPPAVQNIEKKSGIAIMDELIDASECYQEQITALKALSRDIME